MPKRPSRDQLVGKFFPELSKPGTSGDKEASQEICLRACEAILRDMIALYDAGRCCCGPGVLCVRLSKGERKSDFMCADDIRLDLQDAQDGGDSDTAAFLDQVLSKIVSTNPDRAALLLLVDNSSARVYVVDRDNPTGFIKPLLEEVSHG